MVFLAMDSPFFSVPAASFANVMPATRVTKKANVLTKTKTLIVAVIKGGYVLVTVALCRTLHGWEGRTRHSQSKLVSWCPAKPFSHSPSIVTPNSSSTRFILLAIAVFPLLVPAYNKPTGFFPGSVTRSEPESPALMNAFRDPTTI